MACRKRDNQRGSLLLGMLLVSSAVLLGNTFLVLSTGLLQIRTRSAGAVAAMALAEAGVEQAIWEYNYDGAQFAGSTDYDGPGPCPPIGVNITECRQLALFSLNHVGAVGGVAGTATVFVANYLGTAPQVVSIGQLGAASAPSARVQVRLQRTITPSPFTGAIVMQPDEGDILSINNFEGSGNSPQPMQMSLDGYSSAQGAYGGSNANWSARVGGLGSMTINFGKSPSKDNIAIEGDISAWNTSVLPTMLGANILSLDGAPRYGGTRPSLPVIVPPASCNPLPAVPACGGGGSNLNVDYGAVCTLPAGTYCVSNMWMKGTLVTSGKVSIYVSNNTYVGAPDQNNTSAYAPAQILPYQDKPANFRLYASGGLGFTHATIKGMVYHNPIWTTPNSVINDTTFYGSLAGRTSLINASVFHYDHALADLQDLPNWLNGINGGFTPVSVSSWSRQDQ